MTKAELIKALEQYPDDTLILYWDGDYDDYVDIETVQGVPYTMIDDKGQEYQKQVIRIQ